MENKITRNSTYKFLLLLSLLYFSATVISYLVAYKIVKIGPLMDKVFIKTP